MSEHPSETKRVPIRVLLADDHAVVRAGYRFLMENAADIAVIGEATSGEEAIAAYAASRPDVLVLDISMPGIGGMETIRRLKSQFPGVRILMCSMHENPVMIERALQAGACGYISKNSSPEALITAVRRIAAGDVYIDAELAQAMVLQQTRDRVASLGGLSAKELEILRMFAEARSLEDIAEALSLSHKTIANYMTQIKDKLQVSSSAELVRLAIRQQLVSW
jgi:DNA-binding NarL/FixJ family response regulator